jgi:hypothetical protein
VVAAEELPVAVIGDGNQRTAAMSQTLLGTAARAMLTGLGID